MSEYPKRESYFAHRYCRLLANVSAAEEIGPEGVAICMIVAHLEDYLHYTRPVAIWNDSLIRQTGLKKWERLNKYRTKAVNEGWLHYVNRGRTQAGLYFVKIPPQFEGTPDYICDESLSPKIGHNQGDKHGYRQGDKQGDTSTLSLSLSQECSSDDERSSKGKATRPKYPPAFEQWWDVYPRKIGKAKALKSFQRAIRQIGLDDLLEITKRFAASDKGRSGQFCPHPTTWLNEQRWEDDPREWKDKSKAGANGQHQNPKNKFLI